MECGRLMGFKALQSSINNRYQYLFIFNYTRDQKSNGFSANIGCYFLAFRCTSNISQGIIVSDYLLGMCYGFFMIGSIPNVFLQDNATLHALGFASLYDTLRTRMLDPSLLCSSDRNYQFYTWDNIANLGLRGTSTETVLRRGWADMTGYEDIRMRDKENTVYDSYSIESRATVNQISASNARYPVDMFFTWTCNQRKTFGIKNR
jgi:hypothetical protein